eukprot:gnl/TRDRNA2_/TRDRNA2_135048_c0_seq2.p1 gnl/TRDRNA2_/TRDRNA2_135048_c0~~gnl/TRDRNA2_/TRDRNA2_135048_c0_seq2.p1  ORF type:complete len:543 (-),score=79.65 gnl/TRDRNA2_/TRDRNA2_135048_c0_seq2:55-1683(-)
MEKDLRAPLGQPEPDAARESLPGAVTLAEAYDRVGFGRYQARLFIVCGFGFMSDSIEVGLVTALQEEARVEWPDVRGVELAMLTTVVFVGELLGAIIWGPLADRMGRKRAFLASNLAIISFGVLSAAAPSFWWLTALRGLVGVAIGGIIIPFDNLSESVSERHSAPLGFAIEYWWTLGTLYINGLAAVVLQAPWGGWRSLVLLSCVPLVLACLGYFVLDESPTWLLSCVPLVLACLGYFVLDESPTWLLDVGREAEALAVVQKAAAYNGKDLGDAIALVPYERESEPSFRDLFSPELRRRTISLSLIWALGLFGFYGASLANPYIFGASNNGASESSIDYGEVLFASSGEFVGVTLALVAAWKLGGAHTAMALMYVIATLGCVSILFAKMVPTIVLGLLAFVLRIGVMGGNSCAWVVTPPAFPTRVRSTAHGMLNGAGRIGAVLATLWPDGTPLATIMLAYAAANALCGVIAFFEGRALQRRQVFESLASELHASDAGRRSRSIARSFARSSLGAARPSASSRPSAGTGFPPDRGSSPTAAG